jgi:hypothetical protein
MVTKEHRHLVSMRESHPANDIRMRQSLKSALDEVDRLKAVIAGNYTPLRDAAAHANSEADELWKKYLQLSRKHDVVESEWISKKSEMRKMEMDTIPLRTLEMLNDEILKAIAIIAKTDLTRIRRVLAATCQAIIDSRKPPVIVEATEEKKEPQVSEKT